MQVFGFENAKTIKGESLGYVTAIRYLAPATESGFNTCPRAGACAEVCLYSAGRGAFASTQGARIAKTLWRLQDKAGHMACAKWEIERAARKALLTGMKLAVRVNGTSDLPGDAIELARAFPETTFYDYTKIVSTLKRSDLPQNYHLTLSYDPISVPWASCFDALERGINVAVCFATPRESDLPATWRGVKVIDGDAHDLRFLDPRGVIVGLRAKGQAKKVPGFAVEV